MKNVKKWRNTFDLYDKYRLAEFFEKQAKLGWILGDYSGNPFLFRKSEPQNLHYCVIYSPEETVLTTELNEKQKTFCDYCALTGWQLVTSKGYLQVFCNKEEDPVPIETEPEVELANINDFYKSSQKSTKILLALSLVQILLRVISLILGEYETVDRQYDVVTIIVWGSFLLVSLIEYVSYYSWYKKAKMSISLGMGIPATSRNQIRRLIEYGLTAIVLLLLSISFVKIISLQALTVIAIPIAFVLVSRAVVIRILRGKLFARFSGEEKEGLFKLIVAMIMALAFGIFFVLTFYSEMQT